CNDSVEARLNATNQALQPSAGGQIEYWSDATEGEIRDDQGISLHNPDTDVFMKYTLAGAYDSNIALLLTVGDSRLHCYEAMAETIRQTRMRGRDLATNLEFHYGLVNWFIGQNINARPTTRFIVPYLTAVGELKREAESIDLAYAWRSVCRRATADLHGEDAAETEQALALKQTLLLRPLETLLEQPHILAGWLSVHRDSYTLIDGRVSWNDNPLRLLADIYHYLNMDYMKDAPAAGMIWQHDDDLLQAGLAFYEELCTLLPEDDWLALQTALEGPTAPAESGLDPVRWSEVQAAHRGFQAGAAILGLLPTIAESTGFFDLTVNDDLTIHIPERLLETELQDAMAKVLVPPPKAKSDEIIAVSGGMFYGRESPDAPLYVQKGDHFDAGDPLYIVEVMKMFNKVYAPFAGTVDAVLVNDDGVIISKGQPLFKITPDEKIVVESPEERASRRHKATQSYLERL
ncbi:MAG: biotin/lipoyl-containing protein, partial [Pseudomonadota bacterium]